MSQVAVRFESRRFQPQKGGKRPSAPEESRQLSPTAELQEPILSGAIVGRPVRRDSGHLESGVRFPERGHGRESVIRSTVIVADTR